MFSLLLAIIYMSFISLGLPDSLLGSAWPVMRMDFDAPISYAGIISMIIAAGTIISSLMSDRMNKKLGTGLITAISVGMTAVALFGFSISHSVLAVCLWSIPYGLGAGGVDAAINNYVAVNYSARHMSWLHCFWGVGAAISPYIMSAFITYKNSWAGGYRCISIIQIVLTAILFVSLPLWKKKEAENETVKEPPIPLHKVMKIKGVPLILLAFFGYCALETTCGLWASSYLVEYRHTSEEIAAMFASLFYIGITAGRFICGFITNKLGDRKMIRIGIGIMAVGIALIAIPFKSDIPALSGLIILGLGCAPVYPSVIHSTPTNFGVKNSQAIVGVQMASAYTGTTLMPPVFGLIARNISIMWYPFYMLIFVILMFSMTELLYKKLKTQ